jgi:hypothetical protein
MTLSDTANRPGLLAIQRWLSDFNRSSKKPSLIFITLKSGIIIENALAADPTGRVKDVESEIEFVMERINTMGTILRNGEAGKIPLRITHNDTKFNNVLFDEKDKAICVIDLDTVMPGYLAYDFGDSIRTIVNTAAEDEKEIQKIDVNLQFLLTSGFKRNNQLIIKEEVNCAHDSVLPLYMGLRFNSYVEDDVYYKIHSRGLIQRAELSFS